VVKDDITGITAYISYKGYSSSETLLAEASAEVIVMERTKEDGTVVMSICTPDLGITEKGYTTKQPSQELVRDVVLNGVWELGGSEDNVSARAENGKTYVSARCIHGQPVEFDLKK
jgi:chondroitin-sulfate-ABC endolyase/exolyase